ncbi:dynein axonemal heavy chain 7-like [Planococcus citri]|uniref:dynein axonemal heavy chain 7-like n=1 Tax=Planococcus citri TaxID=170843 RepID=UPI0031F82929
MDKLIFAFLIAVNSMLMKGTLDEIQLQMFYEILKSSKPDECIKNMDFLKTIPEDVEQNKCQWVETIGKKGFPDSWVQLNSFQKVLLAQSLCPENGVQIILRFVEDELGKEYCDFGSFDLSTVFKDSNCDIPIAIVLFDDSEPLKCIFNFALHMGISPEKCLVVTLTKAVSSIQTHLEQSMSSGNWLIIRNLQNCQNLLHEVGKICEDLASSSPHPDFRFWIILEHDSFCPSKILKKSQLIAYGASKYVNVESFKKELLIRLKILDNEDTVLNTDLIPNLITFHETLREKPIVSPWTSFHEFTDTDLLIAGREMSVFINKHENVPAFGLVAFMLECCYGNQIDDRGDSEYVVGLMKSFYNDEVITAVKTGKFVESGLIHSKNALLHNTSKLYNFIEEMLTLKRKSDGRKLVFKLLKVQMNMRGFTLEQTPFT